MRPRYLFGRTRQGFQSRLHQMQRRPIHRNVDGQHQRICLSLQKNVVLPTRKRMHEVPTRGQLLPARRHAHVGTVCPQRALASEFVFQSICQLFGGVQQYRRHKNRKRALLPGVGELHECEKRKFKLGRQHTMLDRVPRSAVR